MRNSRIAKLGTFCSLTRLGYYLYSPISILGFPVTVLVANPEASAWLLILGGILLTIFSFIAYQIFVTLDSLLAQRVIPRILNFILAPLIVGGIRGALFYAFVDVLDMKESGDLWNRISASAFTALIWLTTANIVVNKVQEFRSRYKQSVNRFMARNVQDYPEVMPSVESTSELELVQANIFATLANLLKNDGESNLKEMAHSLTEKINLELRPLSRRIWLRSLGEYPVIRFRQMVRDSIRFLEFPQKLFISIMVALALLNNIFIRSLAESTWRTLSYLLILVILLAFRNLSKVRSNYLFLVLVGTLPIIASEFFVRSLGYGGSWIATLLITPVAPAVIVVLSLLILTLRDHDLIIELMDNLEPRQNQIRSHGSDLGERKLASFIHNSLQSEFMALAGQLEEAASSGNEEQVAQLKVSVSNLLNRSFIQDFASFSQSPLERLEAVCKSWSGLLTININIDDSILELSGRNGIIVQTIEEFAANSYRHSKATQIDISATQGEHGIRLELRSNGKQPLKSKKGLGSEWLDQIAMRGWKLESEILGTKLTLEI